MNEAILLKLQGGTTHSEADKCPSCRNGFIRRGVNAADDRRFCTVGQGHRIYGRIAECSLYFPKNLPTIHELSEIAWEITTPKSGRDIGFISPEDRRKAGIGFSTPPTQGW